MRRSIALAASALLSVTMVGAPVSMPLAGAIVHAPRIVITRDKGGHGHGGGGGGGGSSFDWASSNWSGYAVSGGTYTSITGSWTVPTVQPTVGSTYSSSWIGIDGFNNSSLIQAGTEQDYVNGKAVYAAWWEILPAPETAIPSITVHPGDTIKASITRGTTGTWAITISDGGQSFTTNQSYGGPLSSAEWIQEAPSIGGHVATLAHYGEATFDPGTANGAGPNLTVTDGGVMIQHRTQVSTPSVPDSDSDGFNIAYGPTQPAVPAS